MLSDAIEFFAKYRENRQEALNNKRRMRWFTSDVPRLSDLFTDKFSSAAENSEWEMQVARKDAVYEQQQGVRIAIAFLAGCRHDLRSQFAVGTDHGPKTGIDFDRHARSEGMYAQCRLDLLMSGVESKKAGTEIA